MENEHKIILQAALINRSEYENKELTSLLLNGPNWCEIGGQLLIHRLCGYFYNNLTIEQRKLIPKELSKYLKLIVEAQSLQQSSKIAEMSKLFVELEKTDIRYAGLKGIVFCADLYTLADRRSNDIDLFVYEEDLKEFDLVMRSQGFIQSLMPNGQLVEATKSEKLIQRMNYHDLVPYIKILNNGDILEVDINIHFDSKDNLIDKDVFEYGTQLYTTKEYFVRGFNPLAHNTFCIY